MSSVAPRRHTAMVARQLRELTDILVSFDTFIDLWGAV
jgi:hypothetical protein